MQMLKKTTYENSDSKRLLDDLRLYEKRQKFFLSAVLHLLHFIQEFTLELKEINSDAFKKAKNLCKDFAAIR